MSDEFKQEYDEYLKSLKKEVEDVKAEVDKANRANQALPPTDSGKAKAQIAVAEALKKQEEAVNNHELLMSWAKLGMATEKDDYEPLNKKLPSSFPVDKIASFKIQTKGDNEPEPDEVLKVVLMYNDDIIDICYVIIEDVEDRTKKLNALQGKEEPPKEEPPKKEGEEEPPKEEPPKKEGEEGDKEEQQTIQDLAKEATENPLRAKGTDKKVKEGEMDYKSAMLTLYKENQKLRAKLKKMRK